FRSREFEQMEMEFFCLPDETAKWHAYWIEQRLQWYRGLGIRPERLRLRPHRSDELAHYAKACTDIEFEMPFGWSELEGIADRGTYDLSQHAQSSGKDLDYFEEGKNARFVPAVVETSAGVDRTLLAVLVDAYREEEVRGEKRVVLGFHPRVAPVQVVILPLSAKLKEPSLAIWNAVRPHFAADYDDAGSIGRRYRRQDEIGTPFAITYDFQSDQDHMVTVRDRDSMTQERVGIDRLVDYLRDQFARSSS
ncbi:MAG: glycine--tRNA ligase, partial [Deltaproteobacteria bacterium]|nr:glycine--tRNA ligase [Deltaproteobacteria bacterium]